MTWRFSSSSTVASDIGFLSSTFAVFGSRIFVTLAGDERLGFSKANECSWHTHPETQPDFAGGQRFAPQIIKLLTISILFGMSLHGPFGYNDTMCIYSKKIAKVKITLELLQLSALACRHVCSFC